MTIGTIYINGKAYHSQLSDWNEEDGWYEKEEPLYGLDYDGNYSSEMIPKEICLCFAHSSSECCCGAWDTIPDGELG